MKEKKKAIVALSGGVDSSVAAALSVDMGFDSVGIMLKLHQNYGDCTKACGTDTDTEHARTVAKKLNIPFSLIGCEQRFEKEVIEPFVQAYENASTPNPCIECNKRMKFASLFEYADKNGIKFIITGHYARTEFDEKYGRIVLKKAIDETKDQSYVLYSLRSTELAKIKLPLGSYKKNEVRDIAMSLGFENADKKDSQDICFIPEGDYVSFIERYRQKPFVGGSFVNTAGEFLGSHKGIIRYTVGQHKKLGLVTPEPLYVGEIKPESNEIILVKETELYKKEVEITNLSWSAFDTPPNEFRAQAKLRYRHKAADCTVIASGGLATLIFDEGQRAPARGQAAVIYDGDTVLGGGIIK